MQGQYSLPQLHEWHGRLGSVWSILGVSMTHVDEARNRIVIGVQQGQAGALVDAELARLGVPRQAVLVEVVSPILPLRPER